MFAIIPAKLNSQSCPAKNGRHIGGLPLVIQSIVYAWQEGCHPIVVSPDGAVLAIAQKMGASVYFEPVKGKGDILQLIRNVMKAFPAVKYFSLLQPTSPYREPCLLAHLWHELRGKEKPGAFFTAQKLKLQGKVTNGKETHTINSGRRQTNPNWVYTADGNIFIWHRDAILPEGPNLLTPDWEPYTEAPAITHIDIDTEEDYAYAKALEGTEPAKRCLPARAGERIAVISNCPLWMRDHSAAVNGNYDKVVRINDMSSLDNGCTGTKTDIAYVLPGTNYHANNRMQQHADVLRKCERVVFARQAMNGDQTFYKDIIEAHGLKKNWCCVESGTVAESHNKTVLFEAVKHICREHPKAEITVYGDRAAGTRALEHAGNLAAPEDVAFDELIRKHGIEFIQPENEY